MDNSRLGVTETTNESRASGMRRRQRGPGGQDAGGRRRGGRGRRTVGQGGGLLPERHPTADFFVCDILEALPKDDMATMEHPVFSLATRPDLRILRLCP